MKKLISVLLVLVLLLSAVPLSGFVGLDLFPKAAALSSSGWCGPNVTYTFDESTGLLTISGTGKMGDYEWMGNKSPFYSKENIKSVVIDSGVTSIGDYTFFGCSSIKNISVPEGITYIGERAFGSCQSLTDIKLPDSVTSIGSSAFVDCTSLTNVTIPDSVTNIGSSAFSWCRSLTSVTIPDSVMSIGDSAFETNIHILCYKNSTALSYAESNGNPYGLIDGTEEENTFFGQVGRLNWKINRLNCTLTINCLGSMPDVSYASEWLAYKSYIHNVILEENITNIKESAFSNCHLLKRIIIPDSVTSIGQRAFSDCTLLNRVEISSIESWCGITFSNNSANPLYYAHNLYLNGELVTDLVIPNSVTRIGNYAFYGCTSLTSVTIPDNVTSIGYSAFYNCTSLNRVNINSTELWFSINFGDEFANPLYYAHNLYLNNAAVNKIDFPYNINVIRRDPLRYCTNLETVFIYNKNCNISKDAIYINATIYGFKGSTAEAFAEKNGNLFIPLDDIHQHNYKVEGTIAPTCTKDGYTSHICQLCGDKYNDNITPALNHDYVSVVTAPTCTEPGYTTYTCSRCGDSYTADETPAHGHQWNGGEVTTAPTYTATGIKTYTCTVCGKIRTETIAKKKAPTVAQVKGLKTTKQTTKAVTLSWSKAKNADKYIIYRSTDGKKWTKVTTTTKLTYTDSKLKAGAKYQYKVKGYHSASKTSGKYSAVLKTGTITGAPAVTLKSAKSKTATATWKKVTGASKYIVYKSTDGKKWTKVTTTSKLTYTLTKLSGGKKIYVKVTAVNAYGKASAASAVKSVTVKK